MKAALSQHALAKFDLLQTEGNRERGENLCKALPASAEHAGFGKIADCLEHAQKPFEKI
jgi:hypothetical protein